MNDHPTRMGERGALSQTLEWAPTQSGGPRATTEPVDGRAQAWTRHVLCHFKGSADDAVPVSSGKTRSQKRERIGRDQSTEMGEWVVSARRGSSILLVSCYVESRTARGRPPGHLRGCRGGSFLRSRRHHQRRDVQVHRVCGRPTNPCAPPAQHLHARPQGGESFCWGPTSARHQSRRESVSGQSVSCLPWGWEWLALRACDVTRSTVPDTQSAKCFIEM